MAVSRFDALFEELQDRVLALAMHITGNVPDAEDALQETFLAVHRALPRFRGEAQVSTWVYRIALRTALQVRAKRKASTATLVVDAPESVDGERALAARDEARRLLMALEKLSGEHRIVLSLFAMQGLSHQQIAEVLGVAEGTVWSRLHAARKKLQEALADPP